MAAAYNVVLIIVILAAVYGARRALRGRWVSALVIPIVGYIAILACKRHCCAISFQLVFGTPQGA